MPKNCLKKGLDKLWLNNLFIFKRIMTNLINDFTNF